jgi:hypothetical protein
MVFQPLKNPAIELVNEVRAVVNVPKCLEHEAPVARLQGSFQDFLRLDARAGVVLSVPIAGPPAEANVMARALMGRS